MRRAPRNANLHQAASVTLLVLFALLSPERAQALNNCLASDFQDQRGAAQIQIANDNPNNQFVYRPRCVTISEGTRIIFRALPNFGMHPLFGGIVDGGVATMDPDSPIGSIGSGSEAERVLVEVGEFPYFCDFHYADGMMGSIQVVPELFANGFDSPPAH